MWVGNPIGGEPPPPDMTPELTAHLGAGRRREAMEYFLARTGTTAEEIAELRRSPDWARLEGLAHTLVYDMTILRDPALLTERVPTVRVPTLVVDGGDSPANMHRAARAVADALPDGRHRTLNGQVHAVDPRVLAPVIIDFLLG